MIDTYYKGMFMIRPFVIKLILIYSFFVPISFSDSIKCYSYGNLIYSGEGYGFRYNVDDLFIFNESKNDTIVFIKGDCVIKIES